MWTSFQNATYIVMFFAFSLGSGVFTWHRRLCRDNRLN